MHGATDCYQVPLDDIDALKEADDASKKSS
jgi:hypothetical protein